jgi:hypothetical protein
MSFSLGVKIFAGILINNTVINIFARIIFKNDIIKIISTSKCP